MKRSIALIFLVVVVCELIFTWIEFEAGHRITKSLLMPVLLLYLYKSLSRARSLLIFKYACLALVFSFFGDFSLLFQNEYEIAFIIGLGNFLIAHVFYILMFHQIGTAHFLEAITHLKKKRLLIGSLVLIIYGIGLYSFLFPHLNTELKLPVGIYAFVITCMAISLLSRLDEVGPEIISMGGYSSSIEVPKIQFRLIVGVSLFIISDSCIAINQFVWSIPKANFIIMLTYIWAQWLIIRGIDDYLLACTSSSGRLLGKIVTS